MMKKSLFRNLIIFFVIPAIAFLIVQNPLSGQYVEKLKSDAVEVSLTKDTLMLEIEHQKERYEVPPQDAKIDKVWKKMPGYNGLEVDVEASYNKMREEGIFDENKLVFKQIPPKIHLNNLPAAPIFRGHPEKPMVALTINVAWGNEYLSSILTTLKKHQVHATFFIEGRWAKENPELVKMIADGGHELGNHSYSHPNMKTLNSDRIRNELKKTNDIIKAATDKTPTLFAPPSGSFRDEVVEIAHEMNMETIMWTVDTIDWRNPTPHTLLNRVTKQLHNGAIILAHPTKATDLALDQLLEEIKKRGYRIGTVTNLLDEKRIIDLKNHHDSE